MYVGVLTLEENPGSVPGHFCRLSQFILLYCQCHSIHGPMAPLNDPKIMAQDVEMNCVS